MTRHQAGRRRVSVPTPAGALRTGEPRTGEPRSGEPRSGARVDGVQQAQVQQAYDEHLGPLRSYVLRLTAGDHHRTEAILRETLLRAGHRADVRTGSRTSVRARLMRVAHSVAVEEYHAGHARPAEDGHGMAVATAVAAAAAAAGGAVASRADGMLTSAQVRQAFARLTPEHRAVLVDVGVGNRTVNEVASVLGIPVGTVESRTYHALRVLRVLLDEERERA